MDKGWYVILCEKYRPPPTPPWYRGRANHQKQKYPQPKPGVPVMLNGPKSEERVVLFYWVTYSPAASGWVKMSMSPPVLVATKVA